MEDPGTVAKLERATARWPAFYHVLEKYENVEKYCKEVATLVAAFTKAARRMFEQEQLRIINMVSAINPGGSGGTGGNRFVAKEIMEHKGIMNLRMVNGDKSLVRQWHQRFVTALSQVGDVHEEIVVNLVREIDLGK